MFKLWMKNMALYMYFFFMKLVALFSLKQDHPLLTDSVKPPPNYEVKYLEKFKKEPSTHIFSEQEKIQEQIIFDNSKKSFDENKINLQNNLIKLIEDATNTLSNPDLLKKYINNNIEHCDDESDSDIENEIIIDTLKTNLENWKKDLEALNNTEFEEAEEQKNAHTQVLSDFHSSLINSYVMEMTPLGNVAMCYNVSRNSFEYYSDRNIPYRFLEPVGRKYVITFQCKELFVDMEDELKKSLNNENITEKKEPPKEKPKDVFAKFKQYNKEKNVNMGKNRAPTSANIAQPVEKKEDQVVLLKEKSNVYTHVGRFSNYNPLKKIEKKLVDKRLNVSFAEFKKMQLQKNKSSC